MVIVTLSISLYSLRELPLTDFLKYNFVFLSCVLKYFSIKSSPLYYLIPVSQWTYLCLYYSLNYWCCTSLIIVFYFILISKTDQNFHMEQLRPYMRSNDNLSFVIQVNLCCTVWIILCRYFPITNLRIDHSDYVVFISIVSFIENVFLLFCYIDSSLKFYFNPISSLESFLLHIAILFILSKPHRLHFSYIVFSCLNI